MLIIPGAEYQGRQISISLGARHEKLLNVAIKILLMKAITGGGDFTASWPSLKQPVYLTKYICIESSSMCEDLPA